MNERRKHNKSIVYDAVYGLYFIPISRKPSRCIGVDIGHRDAAPKDNKVGTTGVNPWGSIFCCSDLRSALCCKPLLQEGDLLLSLSFLHQRLTTAFIIFRKDRGFYASTDIENAFHFYPSWFAGLHKIIKYPVHCVFMKNTKVPVGKNVFLEGF